MSRKITTILTGSESLNEKLAALTNKQANEAIRKAARPALQPTLAAAKSMAPKRSGALSSSIKIRAIRRSRTRVGMRVTTAKSDSQFSGKTFYGGFIIWGRRIGKRTRRIKLANRKDSYDSRGKVAANNFLKRAADRTRSTALRLYADGIIAYYRSVTK